MIGLFRRTAKGGAVDTAALGSRAVALPLPSGCAVPPSCVGVVVNAEGRTRRASAGARLTLASGERGWCFHPGPYAVDLLPFAAAPELGLHVVFAIDSPDPRVTQQRFDLFLASEAAGAVELASFAQRIEGALQHELAQGNLALPPCTTLDEWNAFRAGINQLLYTRFGVTVDDCVPVDLGDRRDFAQALLARAASGKTMAPMESATATQSAPAFDAARADAIALRRLFLELPCMMGRLRLAALPGGQELFRQHQALLQRLDLVSLSVGTMPALELLAPGQPLAAGEQVRRARHSARAGLALDEAWALLARIGVAGEAALPALFDEADRIVANLEHDCAARRLATLEGEAA
jgi:hypothetical protein